MDFLITAGPGKDKLQKLSSRASFSLNESFSIQEEGADEESPLPVLELMAEKLAPLDKEGRYWCLEGYCVRDKGTTPFCGFFDSANRNGYLCVKPITAPNLKLPA